MCMSSEYIFRTMVILGLSNSKRLIEMYLELLQLWNVGVRTHDNATNQVFIMRATFMWTVNDLPTYGMTSGWSNVGLMGVQFVWMTHRHSICSTVGTRSTLIVINSFSLRTIPTEGDEEKHLLRSSTLGNSSDSTCDTPSVITINSPNKFIFDP
ncbi:UNVERIFIED_CONTAM: hypothetical protein Scaly_2241500 [Sesamum calycinum]|uniref:Uncharacterized protein n=1 Tax=Sesamum calycinum TaxID=2727403 RepID=A0AAW2MB08_9LAMI